NVAFLSKILPNFDAPEAGISRYSDLSPYKIKITLSAPDDLNSIRILYHPKITELKPILIIPEDTTDLDNVSIYENQIIRRNGKTATLWISASQHYETIILSNSNFMRLEINSGTIVRTQSAPGNG